MADLLSTKQKLQLAFRLLIFYSPILFYVNSLIALTSIFSVHYSSISLRICFPEIILKPIDYDELIRALEKFSSLKPNNTNFDIGTLLQLVQKTKKLPSKLVL